MKLYSHVLSFQHLATELNNQFSEMLKCTWEREKKLSTILNLCLISERNIFVFASVTPYRLHHVNEESATVRRRKFILVDLPFYP